GPGSGTLIVSMLTGSPFARATTAWTWCMQAPPERRCSHPKGHGGRVASSNFPQQPLVPSDMTTSLGRRAAATTVLIAGVLGGSPPPAHDAQARPPHEPASPAATGPTATPFSLAGLTTGDTPGIPYAFASKVAFQEGNWQLHRPDGPTLRLPRIT